MRTNRMTDWLDPVEAVMGPGEPTRHAPAMQGPTMQGPAISLALDARIVVKNSDDGCEQETTWADFVARNRECLDNTLSSIAATLQAEGTWRGGGGGGWSIWRLA